MRAHHPRDLLLAACLILALAPGCGLASRRVFLSLDARRAGSDPEAVEALRGVEPTAAGLWGLGAELAAAGEGPEEALAILDQGQGFLPADPRLSTARVDLLGYLERPEEQMAAIDQALASLPEAGLEAWLRRTRSQVLIDLGRLDEANEEILRLGGVISRPDPWLSDSWARLALAREALGQPQLADLALEASLQAGPWGLPGMRRVVLQRPERVAPLRTLQSRAVERHPGHPDLLLAHSLDQMVLGRFDEAEHLLDALPRPLPARLESEVTGYRARLAIQQGRVAEGVGMLTRRLDEQPADAAALAGLFDAWRTTGQPPTETTRAYLLRARRHARDPLAVRQLDSLLEMLERSERPGSAAPEGPSAPPSERQAPQEPAPTPAEASDSPGAAPAGA